MKIFAWRSGRVPDVRFCDACAQVRTADERAKAQFDRAWTWVAAQSGHVR